jgi:ABC-type phosphate/phosphonate transport system substrate-binding protein
MRWIALAAGALIVALLAAGCGGDSDEASTTAISKAAFIKKADAICTKGTARLASNFSAFLKKQKLKQLTQADEEELVGKVLVPGVKREIKELRALGAPSGDEDRVNEMTKALEEGLETAEGNPEAVTSSSDVVFGIAARLAGEYGLEACGSR